MDKLRINMQIISVGAAKKKGLRLNVIPGVAKLMDEWIDKKHGKED